MGGAGRAVGAREGTPRRAREPDDTRLAARAGAPRSRDGSESTGHGRAPMNVPCQRRSVVLVPRGREDVVAFAAAVGSPGTACEWWVTRLVRPTFAPEK
jgi:hypothetical protein